jgi:chromate transporter
VNPLLLYLILVKGTLTSFSGPSSLAVVRDELVVNRHILTDTQLNASMVVGRATPGPNGLYIVSVGYLAGGVPGGIAGWLAMITPALVVIPIVQFLGRYSHHPILRNVLNSVILGGIGLVISTIGPLARSSIDGLVPLAAALGSCAVLIFARIHTVWIVVGAAAVTLTAYFLHLS